MKLLTAFFKLLATNLFTIIGVITRSIGLLVISIVRIYFSIVEGKLSSYDDEACQCREGQNCNSEIEGYFIVTEK